MVYTEASERYSLWLGVNVINRIEIENGNTENAALRWIATMTKCTEDGTKIYERANKLSVQNVVVMMMMMIGITANRLSFALCNARRPYYGRRRW